MVAISLTLLPALLGFAGHRIDALPRARHPAPAPARPARETGLAPVGPARLGPPVALPGLGASLVLVLLAAPAVRLRLGMTDNGT